MNSLNTTLVRPIIGIGALLTIVVAALFFMLTNRYVVTALENQAIAIVWNAEAVTRLVSYAEDLEWHLVSLKRDVEAVEDIAVVEPDGTVVVATMDVVPVALPRDRSGAHLVATNGSRYTYWVPFHPGTNEVVPEGEGLGVIIALDGTAIETQIQAHALLFLMVSSLGIGAITLVSRGLMRKHVLAPLARIRSRLNSPTDRADIPVERDDEIGEVASGLRSALVQLNDTVMKLEMVMENITDGILTARADGAVITANRSALELLEVDSLTDVVLRDCVETVENSRLDLAGLADSGLQACVIKVRNHRVPGELMVRRMTAVHDDLFTVVLRDISERQEYERRLIEARDRAEESARAKSEFLATMSHEIRTPMNGVLGMTQLMLDMPMSDDQRSMAKVVQSSAESLLGIINDILDFSKVESGRMEFESIVFDVAEVVQQVVDLMQGRAMEKELQLRVDIEESVARQRIGDGGRLRQILLNLVGNAIKFTEQGQIHIHIKTLGGEQLRFSVRDTGIGIPIESQSRLFESFTQADASTTRRFGGTGLGLAICKRLVELRGGSIGVASEPGRGSEFWFVMPLAVAAEQDQPVAAAVTRVSDAVVLQARVLLVEDNTVNQKVAVRMLQKFGCTVDVAADGIEAVDMWERFPYDLIFMDCQMPRMDGYAASSLIREKELASGRGAIHIIALTANALAEDRDACLSAGMNDFISKPVTLRHMEESLRRFQSLRPA